MTETLSFRIIESNGPIELREYPPYIVAEVDVIADSVREAAEKGFRPLADYIFGGNQPAMRIAMTAPVTAEPSSKQITVSESPGSTVDDAHTVRFSMPSKWTIQTLPEPKNPDIRLVEIGPRQLLAITLRGRDDPSRVADATDRLLDHAAERNLVVEGEPIWAGYSAPYIPVPLRKWEMLVGVKRSDIVE